VIRYSLKMKDMQERAGAWFGNRGNGASDHGGWKKPERKGKSWI